MSVASRYDLLVVGAGPAGMAGAARAAENGLRVAIADDNPAPGGQIWRGEARTGGLPEAVAWAERVRRAGVTLLTGTRVVDAPQKGEVLVEVEGGAGIIGYRSLLLATGARERFLPFPGWTLPNVFGAGGLQAMAKSGLPMAGKRVVVAGSGPLLIAVAAYLSEHGATVPVVCEQASRWALAGFGFALLEQPGKIAQGLRLRRSLRDTKLLTGCWPAAARGKEKLEAVVLQSGGRREQIACDYLACGFHLTPNIELAQLLGCRIENGCVSVDDRQQTSQEGIYCAGEPTGIGGLELGLVEGEIAGIAAASGDPSRWFGKRARLRRFARRMDRAFALRTELRTLPQPDTILCRCEDVLHSHVESYSRWRDAKLHTRCGMGPCQGRVCGAALEFLRGWKVEAVRPPVFPALIGSLSGSLTQDATAAVKYPGS